MISKWLSPIASPAEAIKGLAAFPKYFADWRHYSRLPGAEDLRLAEAIARLPEDQREALILQRWHQWSLAQIAEYLGRSQPAVAGLLHRALKQLKEELREVE